MTPETKNKLESLNSTLELIEKYYHACAVISYDMETICPEKGMEAQGELEALLGNEAFKLRKDEKFIEAAEYLYEHRDELDPSDRILVKQLHRGYLQDKNITPEKQMEFSLIYNKAFVDWTNARKESNFALFADSLAAVDKAGKEMIELREEDPEDEPGMSVYDKMLNDYERGMTSKRLDATFERCKEVLVPMLKKITESKKSIRRDFLNIEVTDEQQKKMADYLLEVLGFDFTRGAYTTSEHPFTNGLAKDDTRVTTHYYPTEFASSMYSIIHEGGHALFEQLQPQEDFDHHIQDYKTLGMHESVSRFYENRIGRSKAFIHLIYPKVCEIFPQVMRAEEYYKQQKLSANKETGSVNALSDQQENSSCPAGTIKNVTEEELYLALNIAEPSLIRTEADEFTYTLHIIIRYVIEKEIVGGTLAIADIPKRWKEKYREYLGIEPATDREGVLQDVHWSSGFGYFPTYAIGNMYNSMYYNLMKQEFDIDAAVEAGDFGRINGWMKEHVFAKANRLDPAEWIKDLTGREFTPEDFLEYIKEKFTGIYDL
ncbi:MAG: carboxypeptidase M32 [Lachnospiraceae bacterium]|nr:carboxypeptidase M32 [Lachnospiraceae bacterium]